MIVSLDSRGLVPGLDVIVAHAKEIVRIGRLQIDEGLLGLHGFGPLALLNELGQIAAELFFIVGHGSLAALRLDGHYLPGSFREKWKCTPATMRTSPSCNSRCPSMASPFTVIFLAPSGMLIK